MFCSHYLLFVLVIALRSAQHADAKHFIHFKPLLMLFIINSDSWRRMSAYYLRKKPGSVYSRSQVKLALQLFEFLSFLNFLIEGFMSNHWIYALYRNFITIIIFYYCHYCYRFASLLNSLTTFSDKFLMIIFWLVFRSIYNPFFSNGNSRLNLRK